MRVQPPLLCLCKLLEGHSNELAEHKNIARALLLHHAPLSKRGCWLPLALSWRVSVEERITLSATLMCCYNFPQSHLPETLKVSCLSMHPTPGSFLHVNELCDNPRCFDRRGLAQDMRLTASDLFLSGWACIICLCVLWERIRWVRIADSDDRRKYHKTKQ